MLPLRIRCPHRQQFRLKYPSPHAIALYSNFAMPRSTRSCAIVATLTLIDRSGEEEPSPHGLKATFAAGCFWGVEEAFREIPGVISTTVGYTGGTLKNPTYQDVCSGRTGHAEALEVEFGFRARVSYLELLAMFWKSH